MDQATINNLLVGGAIGFTFSTLGSLFAFLFQMIRDKKSKEWEEQERIHKESKTIIDSRIIVLETQIDSAVDELIKALNAIRAVSTGIFDADSIEDFKVKYFDFLVISDGTKMIARALYFHDEDLQDIIIRIISISPAIVSIFDKLIVAIKNNDIQNVNIIKDDISEIKMELSEVLTSFYTRIDLIRSNADSQIDNVGKAGQLDTSLRKLRTIMRRKQKGEEYMKESK